MRRTRTASLLLVALAVATPAYAQQAVTGNGLTCTLPTSPMLRTTLYFGLSIPGGGKVGKSQWRAFLADTVTPRFPQGFTVVDARGQWQGADGRIAGEDTKLLQVVHPADATADTAIRAIADTYKQRFRQEAVGRAEEPICAVF